MSRVTVTLLVLLFGGSYFMLLGWSGTRFISFARQPASLSLEKQPVTQVAFGEPVTLEIVGSGFDESTRVQSYFDVNNRRAIVGSFPIGELVNDMLLVGDRLFLANTNGGLQVLDVKNRLAPELIQTILPRSSVLDIEKHGDRYILSCAARGIYIYTETAQGLLKKSRRLYLSGSAIESRVVGDYLYVAAGRRGVLVYDLNNIDDGTPVHSLATGETVLGIESFEDYLYFSSGSGGLAVYRLLDPQKPQYVGTIAVSGRVRRAKRQQDKLFLIEHDKVSLYQLGQSTMPQLLESEFFTGKPDRLQVIDQHIYIIGRASGVHRLSFTPDGQARSSGFIDVGGNPRAIVGRGNYLYIASSKTGLQIFDRRLVSPRQLLMNAATENTVNDFFVKGRWMVVADGQGGGQLRHLDRPDEVVLQLTDDSCWSVYVQDRLLYLVKGSTGVEVFDVSEFATPKTVTDWPELTDVGSLIRYEQYLLLAKGRSGLSLVDISEFDQPVVVDLLPDIHAMNVEVYNGLFFVAGEKSGVSIYRISEQAKLELVSKIVLPFPLNDFSAAHSLKVTEGIAYIANAQGGLLIADVRNPQKPVILSSIALPGVATSLAVAGQTVYVSSKYSGVHIVDVSDVEKPRLLVSFSNYGTNRAMQLSDGLIFVANGNQGVIAYPIPQKIIDFKVVSDRKLRVTLPSPEVPGRYSLRVSNWEQSATLDGVLRYSWEL